MNGSRPCPRIVLPGVNRNSPGASGRFVESKAKEKTLISTDPSSFAASPNRRPHAAPTTHPQALSPQLIMTYFDSS